ncbi:hypothetical protein [Clostridium botulinum]|uniref:hypothetical protein n=2 Tax=Clostridium botulinum TaxID=1491 RepID=UPI000D13197F|nr:hypothetical protein [Clostridium botulinum]AVQ47668.1 hypothetical protein C7M60_18735 [Clostridium botulinum]AVQ51215.1 hypothetical protein C7M58_18705 [Clostridium botulinum]
MAIGALGIVEVGLDLAVGDNTSAAVGLLCLFPMGKGFKYVTEIGGDAIKGGSKVKNLYKAEGLLKMDLQKFGKGITKAAPEKVVNKLSNYESKRWIFENGEFMLDKRGMKHILERHHPEYWNGSVKSTQTFLDKNMDVGDITNTISEILKQNRERIIEKSTTGMYQIEGTVNGIEYVVGVNKGRIGQFYKK